MMFASESTATFNPGPESTGSRGASCRKPPRTWSAFTAAVVAKLREFAPYAAILALPGGSVMALGLWLYRRQRRAALLAAH
jgi:sensor c-di-GMP phosphodiesterase-like protein